MASDRDTVRTIAAAGVATDLLAQASLIVADMRAMSSQISRAADAIAASIEAGDDLRATFARQTAEIRQLVSEIGVPHRWIGTALSLGLPGGGYSPAVDLMGKTGASAFELAVEEGFTGTRAQWLASLEGEPGIGVPGRSAFMIAVDNGFQGTPAEWLASLKGAPGDTPDPIDPATLLDDGEARADRTWSSAQILAELAALRVEIEAGTLGPKVTIPAGVGSGLLLALPQPKAFSAKAPASAIVAPSVPAGAGTGLLLALPLTQPVTV